MTTCMGRVTITIISCILTVALVGAGATPAGAQTLARATSIAGQVQYRTDDAASLQALSGSVDLPSTGSIITGPDGLAEVRYSDGTVVSIKQNSVVKVGGKEEGGIWVRLGRVVVRVQRMLSSGEPTEVRTPIAVAAVRGTEFGVWVDETTRTQIYVFEGTVGVSNVQVADREVMVGKGEMTTVVPLRPPSTPAPFSSGEFDRLGQLNRLERGEDPVMESTEEPASEAYLAYPDPEIDAVRNPAYLGVPASGSSTTLFSTYGSRRSEHLESAGVTADLSRFSSKGALGQHVSLWPVSPAWRVGVALDGEAASDDATVAERAPLSTVSSLIQRETDRRKGKGQVMAAWAGGNMALGMSGYYHRSRIEVTDRPALVTGTGDLTTTRNRAAGIQAGLLSGRTRDRNVGVAFTHEFLKSTADAGALHKHITGHNNVGELLYRSPIGSHRGAGLIRLERVKTHEDVSDGGNAVYQEDRTVWSAKGGVGIGISPAQQLLIGVDLVGGYSDEKATQHLPAGGVREDEDDVRHSLNLHVGAQAMVSESLMLFLDINNQAERLTKDFLLLPGAAEERSESDVRTLYRTSASSGISLIRPGYAIQYLIASGASSEAPVSHHLVLVLDLR
jgi:hypothetical protein